jgi:mRNA interferase MazF
MKINQFDIWLADLNPRLGTESGKSRPVVVVQTDLLNHISHPSTIICPLTTDTKNGVEILRVRIVAGISNLDQECDMMIDQIRAIDNRRLLKKIGNLPDELILIVKKNIKICLDL